MSVQFLTAQLGSNARIIVEVAWGANLAIDAALWTWTDITSDVRQADGQRIVINPFGHADWLEQAQPAEVTFELDNTSGAYSKGPQSSNYPNVRRSTPIRVQLTLNGITKYVRFFGYVYSWKPWWDTSGNLAVVTVKAAGKLRQLQQGKNRTQSAMFRAISMAAVQPVAYYPFEDGDKAQQANSPIAGAPPATFAYQQYVGAPHFAAVDGPPGSDRLPDFSKQGNFKVTLPAQATATTWRVQCVAKTNALPTTSDFVAPLEFFTNNGATLNIVYIAKPAGISPLNGLTFQDNNGHAFGDGVAYDDGLWHEIRVVMTQSGGNIVLNVFLDGALRINQTYAGTLNNVSGFNGSEASQANSDGYAAGHFAVWNTNSGLPDTVAAMGGYAGELVTDRLTRLLSEQGGLGLPLVTVGTTTTTMGPQGVDTFLNLLRECEATGQGLLFDGMTQAFTYVTRSARYSQSTALTLDVSAGEADDPLAPEDDDQRNLNLATVNRKDGTSVTYEDATGPLGTGAIGDFASSITVNVQNDSQVTNIAAWIVHVGTGDEPYRYPTLGIDLAASPARATDWLNTTLCERIDVTNINSKATQHPAGTVSLLLEGYSEELSPFDWIVKANCSPYQPWQVDTLGGLFRLEMAGQTLASNLVAGATSLSLATAAGNQLFTTLAADFPMDLNVGGWMIHVTAASGTSSPQTLTVSASPNTSTIPSTTAVTLWRPAVLAL